MLCPDGQRVKLLRGETEDALVPELGALELPVSAASGCSGLVMGVDGMAGPPSQAWRLTGEADETADSTSEPFQCKTSQSGLCVSYS